MRLLEEARRLRAKRRFGQNFLVDEAVLATIVDVMALQPGEQILEIGPGSGFLTEQLLKANYPTTCVEMENAMQAYLTRKFEGVSHFTLVHSDILRYDLTTLPAPLNVVGNIPYNITTPILFYLCGEIDNLNHPLRQRISRITLMVQKEVAERVTAKSGSKAYNHLSIAIQCWFDASMVMIVPPKAFYPAPKVASAVISLTPRQTPRVSPEVLPIFATLIKSAFAQRRKTLKNSLLGSRFATVDVLDRMFARLEIMSDVRPTQRAEQLSIEDFEALAHAYCHVQN